eukprot:CCRYP_016019-RA/>CCRYP_016019-RA protein AED:0.27 eAED:0.27 QI:310/1/1/1/0.5/0.33/3/356/402
MGRVFSTVYRVFLMGVSVAAVALSIIAATSCSFLDFVHPYTADGRSLTIEMVGSNKIIMSYAGDVFDVRILQNNTESEGPDVIQETTATPSTVGLVPIDSLAQPADSLASNMSSAISSRKNISESLGNESVYISNSSTTGKTVVVAETNTTGSQAVVEDVAGNTSMLTNSSDENATNLNTVWPVSIKGSAGLFCAPNDDAIYNVWKKTFIGSVNTINDDGARDESEDLARSGAVVSATLGALVALIFIVECILGLKICCEKWIVSLLAVSACISQGLTFLLFNSERYCDANIIHEILEQNPCVVGTGAIISIVALIMYACVIVLVCRVPQDHPYHLLCCCRAQKGLEGRKTESFQSLEMVEDSHSGRGLAGTNTDGVNVAISGRGHASAPQWLSEQEENEII